MPSCGRSCLLLPCLLLFLFVRQSFARPARVVQGNSENGNKVLRLELLHRDHPESPLSAEKTISERLLYAVKRSEQRRGLLLRVAEPTDFQSPLKTAPEEQPGNGIEYVMSLSIGTPAKKFIVIVDTGSDLAWLQCNCIAGGCYNQTDPFFNSSASTSYSPYIFEGPLCTLANLGSIIGVAPDGGCTYVYGYGDGSLTVGELALETIHLTDAKGSSTTIEKFVFGCSGESNDSFNGADGLFGFGQGPLSLPSQMSALYPGVFSFCLVPFHANTKSSSQLLFGSTTSAKDFELTKTPIISNPYNPSFYYVPMIGITLNGKDLGIPASTFAINSTTGEGGVFLDSGTTVTFLDEASVNAILGKVVELVKYPRVTSTEYSQFPLCYDISQVKKPIFPKIAFLFVGIIPGTVVEFPLASENLFVPVDDPGHVLCAPLIISNTTPYIIGNVVQSNHLMEYDLVNKHVGWRQQSCESGELQPNSQYGNKANFDGTKVGDAPDGSCNTLYGYASESTTTETIHVINAKGSSTTTENFAGQSIAQTARELKGNSENENKVLRLELLHRDHPKSPLSAKRTLSERFLESVKRSEQRRGLLVRFASATDFQSPVKTAPQFGHILGDRIEYVMSFSIGTPAKKFIVIVDTGSDLTWLQCNCLPRGCYNQTDPFFYSNASTSISPYNYRGPLCTLTNLGNKVGVASDYGCAYFYGYGSGGTTAGELAWETIHLTDSKGSSTTIENFVFGCSWQTTDDFNGADGIIGFGQGPLSLPSQMSALYPGVFSFCLVPFHANTKSSSQLLFGSTASAKDFELTKTSILRNPYNPSFYYVPMIGITVNGKDLGISASTFAINLTTGSGGVLLDSGTTGTLLDLATVIVVLAKVAEHVKHLPIVTTNNSLLCYDVSEVKEPEFPALAFLFAGVIPGTVVEFPLAPENLFTPVDDTGHRYCAQLFASDDLYIIGNVAQANHLMEYDLLNKHVGWRQQSCE